MRRLRPCSVATGLILLGGYGDAQVIPHGRMHAPVRRPEHATPPTIVHPYQPSSVALRPAPSPPLTFGPQPV
ncbi:MAG TPA: hypothetical protein VFT74_17175, partial [Isosphaeraceae bacterium]|nr:hypothetical protein [Isosphaeraceae bacterium]